MRYSKHEKPIYVAPWSSCTNSCIIIREESKQQNWNIGLDSHMGMERLSSTSVCRNTESCDSSDSTHKTITNSKRTGQQQADIQANPAEPTQRDSPAKDSPITQLFSEGIRFSSQYTPLLYRVTALQASSHMPTRLIKMYLVLLRNGSKFP